MLLDVQMDRERIEHEGGFLGAFLSNGLMMHCLYYEVA